MISRRTLLNQQVMASLKKIKPDFYVPGRSTRFNTNVRLVTRDYHAYDNSEMPTLYFESATTTSRHLLADVREETMRASIAGFLTESQQQNMKRPSADSIDGLSDDVAAILALDPTWNQVALRTRVGGTSQSTQVEELTAGFITDLEIDYLEYFPLGTTPAIPDGAVNINGQAPRTPDPNTDPQRAVILDSFFNTCLATTGLNWVEQASQWPIPFEQIPSIHTPGFFFQDVGETYGYGAAFDTKKVVRFQSALLALEFDRTRFIAAREGWVSKIKLLLGNNSDLRGIIQESSIREIRTDKSEYPLIHCECDFDMMYISSYERA